MLPRYLNARLCTLLCVFVVACLFLLASSSRRSSSFNLPVSWQLTTDLSAEEQLPFNRNPRIACKGPRDVLLTVSSDDQIREVTLDVEYPVPMGGSHQTVGMQQTWHTADGRYGPYGFGEDKPNYNRSRVQWASLDWGELQNDCVQANRRRFPVSNDFSRTPRMALRDKTAYPAHPPRQPSEATGRTAIVVRTWDAYKYRQEDLMYLRSLIVEAALSNSGDFAVFLLIDIKDKKRGIWQSKEKYNKVVEAVVPPELQGIAVLFDENLLNSWYPDVDERRTDFQVMQPFQIFAHFYDQFDHYWQLEMDTRFTGHTGRFFTALGQFAKEQPRKQARERASYSYIPQVHGTYADFTTAVNRALNGSGLWGPLKIPDITPIGPVPPTKSPKEDDFQWGVGEQADLIVLKPCADVHHMVDWVYKDWTRGFQQRGKVPRTVCPPAQGRASFNLLNEIHRAQATDGLALPAEATLPSFALYHGLKMILAPQPYYQNPRHNITEMDKFWNGGPIGSSPLKDGMGWGDGMYNAMPFYNITKTTTWGWSSPFGNEIVESWLGIGEPLPELPYVLHNRSGQIYCPNLAIHPRKTNK